ncbi:Protein of unknown function (DUF3752) [Teratosphaeria destructans]|uniref:DUF3752 domain-containing protein n=1 Tax=Teratosphaeria destructans TaxID=418781 RepID=A0A9W7SRW8_9PEZI|nr:Protein of unknown function (DUF3752) [Teratosphaeria destructans]
MSALGPDLPPHLLAKRKRREEEEDKNEPAIASGALRSPSPHEKRPRVIGPAMPPAPLAERPIEPPEAEGSDSEEDDDFGPALPTASAGSTIEEDVDNQDSVGARPAPTASADKPKRDDWMMMPPQQDGLAARLDPSKPRARGFNTGKGAKGPSAGPQDGSSWHETPEQKQKRLQDEMMGIGKADTAASGKPVRPVRSAKDEAAAARQKEQIVSCLRNSLGDMVYTDTSHRREAAAHHLWNGTSRVKVLRRKTIPANVPSIETRIWLVDHASAAPRRVRC